MNNLFISLPFLEELHKKGYNGTGTIRVNRLGKNCPLVKPEMMKKSRGSVMSYETVIPGSLSTLRVAQWLDNSVVTVASSQFGLTPQSNIS